MDSDRVVLTLVHGTWARDAEWVKETSDFVKELNSLPAEVEIRRFPWSGGNRFTARRDASDALSGFLSQRQGEKQYIIAHSHGGNVAVRAALLGQEQVNGLVCLSTPFLSLLRRDPDFILGSCFAMLTMGSLVAGLGLVFLNFTGSSNLLGDDSLLLGVGLFLSMVICGLLYSYGSPWLRAIQGVRTGQFTSGESALDCPVLCVNRAEDEAMGVLSLVDILSNIPSVLISRITLPLLWVVVLLLTVLGVVPSLADFGEVSQAIAQSAEAIVWLTIALFVGGSSLTYVGLFALAAVASTLAFSFLFAGVAFGDWTRPLGNLYARLIVSWTPLHSRRAEFVEAPLQPEGGGQGLLHGVYDDPGVQRKVRNWIAKQIRRSIANAEAPNHGMQPDGASRRS